GKHSDGKEKDGDRFGEHSPRVSHQVWLKGEQKGYPGGLRLVMEQPSRKEERDVDRDHAEHERDQAAGKLHVGYGEVEERYEQGIKRGEDAAKGLAEKAFRELFGHRRIAYPV